MQLRLRIPVWLDGFVAAAIALLAAMRVYVPWPIDLRTPFVAAGDGLSAQYIIKSILEHGTYALNPDVGAPFGATMYDYPIPEPTHHLFIRFIGLFTHDPFLTFNLFYLSSFAAAAWTACWALQRNGIERLPAIAGAIAFALLPYHFFRIGHVFLASYAAIPVLCHYALQLANYNAPHVAGMPRARWQSVLAIAIAAGTGVYYAFFGLFFIVVATAIGFARSRHGLVLKVGAAYAAVIALTVGLSLLPNTLFHHAEGANPLIANRAPVEAEIFGLKLTQMLFPNSGHRIGALREFMGAYNASAPLVNENMTSSIGLIGTIGFLIALVAFVCDERRRFRELWVAGALCVTGVLYATVGGFGAIVARTVLPEIRGLNRVSVFIAFFAFFAFLAAMRRLNLAAHSRLANPLLAGVMIVVTCADEIPTSGVVRPQRPAFEASREFFTKVQSAVPAGTAVFELPYTYFPESAHRVGSYALLEPYLFTHDLRWSFGDMHGRPSDLWNEQASMLTGNDFAGALARAGFGAVYVDRRGYKDNGAAIEKELRSVLGAPVVENATLARALYRVAPPDQNASPLITADVGRGWGRWERNASGETSWSLGDADLIVANPNGASIPFSVRFKLNSATVRKVTLSYGEQVLSSVQLKPGEPMDLTASFDAQAGISRLAFETDAPVEHAVGGTRKAFSISELSYATGISR
jgi:phosphoglycerol transferase